MLIALARPVPLTKMNENHAPNPRQFFLQHRETLIHPIETPQAAQKMPPSVTTSTSGGTRTGRTCHPASGLRYSLQGLTCEVLLLQQAVDLLPVQLLVQGGSCVGVEVEAVTHFGQHIGL